MFDLPQKSYLQENPSTLSRWKLIQSIRQHFWKRWLTDYLHTLQIRKKWHENNVTPEVGTLVLIREDDLPPMKWEVGRLIKLIPGKDNVVRVAVVKTLRGKYKRHMRRLCPLPIE